MAEYRVVDYVAECRVAMWQNVGLWPMWQNVG